MLGQIFQVLIDVDRLLVQFLQDFLQQVVCLCKFRVCLAHVCLVLLELLTYMLEHLAEMRVVKNQPQNHRFVDVNRWKFVRVAFIDDLRDVGKVF